MEDFVPFIYEADNDDLMPAAPAPKKSNTDPDAPTFAPTKSTTYALPDGSFLRGGKEVGASASSIGRTHNEKS